MRRFFVAAEAQSGGQLEGLIEPVAAAYHWPPDVILDLDLDELVRWKAMAEARLQATHQAQAAHLAQVMAMMFGAK